MPLAGASYEGVNISQWNIGSLGPLSRLSSGQEPHSLGAETDSLVSHVRNDFLLAVQVLCTVQDTSSMRW